MAYLALCEAVHQSQLERAVERVGKLVHGWRTTQLGAQALGVPADCQRPLLDVARDVNRPLTIPCPENNA